MFSSLDMNGSCQESISFVNNSKGKVMGLGKIAISNYKSLDNFLLVESLTYNLLLVSQLCTLGYDYCLFTNKGVSIYRRDDSSIVFKGRMKGKLYLVDFQLDKVKIETYLMTK